jgi:hypothetical protein
MRYPPATVLAKSRGASQLDPPSRATDRVHESGRMSTESQRERRSGSLSRTAMSLFTTAFGRGRSTGKCSEPLVIV